MPAGPSQKTWRLPQSTPPGRGAPVWVMEPGAAYQALVEAVFDATPDIGSGVEACFEGAAATLRMTDYADACPIATVALEVASSDEPLRLVTAEIFERWLAAASTRLEAAG